MKPTAGTVAFSPFSAVSRRERRRVRTDGPKRAVHGGNIQALGTGI